MKNLSFITVYVKDLWNTYNTVGYWNIVQPMARFQSSVYDCYKIH